MSFYSIFVKMAGKRYSTEEALEMILNMDGLESSDSLDNSGDSDSESASQSEVESDPNVDFAARRISAGAENVYFSKIKSISTLFRKSADLS